ncbi:putative LRR receptor-like serine/threonine-protein kinase IRK [Vitis vinifera]|uniref:Putative LRR receptor-like serine/threonine-protein kinase IRK n=1 Tax=Vitis vinifera TaxID=29760 RepID=A0A438HF85_VITVI|nr:putative LRR receptor-like serine/threonine-protein kinase IRK [Vitis vinifera]
MAISKAMIVFPLLCFLFSTISTLSHPNTLVCNETEKRALLSFKHALSDPGHQLSSWSTHEDCCGWNGVYCHNITSRVIKLDLTNPDSSNFSLGGKLGNLSNLQHLSLGSGYSFYVPQLYVENLGWISHLSSLKHLTMYEVDLQREVHWLESISMLSSLSELYLVACELDNMSPSLGLNGSLPSRLWLLSNLEYLYIGNNSLEGTISEVHFNKLSKLKYLDMSSTSLIFKVKASWVPPFQLDYMWMSSCQMGPNFPTWLQTQTSLQYLDISKSGIVDIAPKWFWKWASHIDVLIDLSDNQISGNLSGVLLNNTYIDLSSNCFMGELPRLSPQVSVLNMANNSFSGPISPFLCQKLNGKCNLEVLDMSTNSLSGELSHCWTYWQSLTHLNLGNNNLSGKIPGSMGSLFELEALHLHNNSLSGDIPPSLRNCTSLGLLDLGGYDYENLMLVIKGKESEYGSILKFVRSIDLSTEKMGRMKALESLDLSRNHLSGEIPQSMKNLSFLSHLNLSYNNFSGRIPSGTQLQSFDAISYIGNAELCGAPLTKNCTEDEDFQGFWGVCGALLFKKAWRHAYFQFLYRVKDWVYVAIAIRLNRLQNNLRYNMRKMIGDRNLNLWAKYLIHPFS